MKFERKSGLLAAVITLTLSGTATAENENLVSASDILNSNVRNELNTVGDVDDLILDETGSAIEYLLFRTNETFTLAGEDERLFAAVESVDFGLAVRSSDPAVVLDGPDSQRMPEELTITRKEADHRLLTNVLESSLWFENEESRRIDDINFDADTGEIVSYEIEMSNDSFFEDDIRAIPADEVMVNERGLMTSSSTLMEVSSNSSYSVSSR